MTPGWGKVPAAAKYAGVSVRTFRKWLDKGLAHSRLDTGTILIRFTDIDEFLGEFQSNTKTTDKFIESIIKDF